MTKNNRVGDAVRVAVLMGVAVVAGLKPGAVAASGPDDELAGAVEINVYSAKDQRPPCQALATPTLSIAPENSPLAAFRPLKVDAKHCVPRVSKGVAVSAEARSDTDAMTVNDLLARTERYYRAQFGSLSYDDRGTAIQAVVHTGVRFPFSNWDEKGQAFWFGDADGQYRSPARALSIVCHEYFHAVHEHKRGTVPNSNGETLVLAEAYADRAAIGCLSRTTWKIGRELTADGNGLRDLSQPGVTSFQRSFFDEKKAYPYPARMGDVPAVIRDDKFLAANYVSTVVSHGLFLIDRAVGPEVSDALFKRLALEEFQPDWTLRDHAQTLLRIAREMYPMRLSVMMAVKAALIQTQLLQDQPFLNGIKIVR